MEAARKGMEAWLIALKRLCLPDDESVERIETPRSASNRSGAHRFGLQYPPRSKHGARFVGTWSRDEGTKIEPKLDNVKFRKLLQGATDARPADPEARRKCRLTNPAAGADMLGDDAQTDYLMKLDLSKNITRLQAR